MVSGTRGEDCWYNQSELVLFNGLAGCTRSEDVGRGVQDSKGRSDAKKNVQGTFKKRKQLKEIRTHTRPQKMEAEAEEAAVEEESFCPFLVEKKNWHCARQAPRAVGH